MRIKHITFRVKDLDRTIEFYETMTEHRVVRRFSHGETRLAFLSDREGATELEFLQVPGGQTYEGKGMFICFETDKLDEMHDLAVSRGMKPSPIQLPDDGTRYFYVYDPDGISVQLRTFNS